MEDRDIYLETSQGPRGVNVIVREPRSRVIILMFELNPTQVFNFVTGHNESNPIRARVMGPQAASRVGKEVTTYTRSFRAEDYKVYQRVREGDVPPDLDSWAQEMGHRTWAESMGWSAHNQQRLQLTLRRYDDESLSADMRATIQATLNMAEPPTGLLAAEAKR